MFDMVKEMNFGLPKMKVEESSDEVVVKIFISGMTKNDFEVEVRGDFLKIRVGKDFEKSEDNEKVFRQEWKSSFFEGEVLLPCKVVPIIDKKIYSDNVFEIRLKKSKIDFTK